MEVPDAESLDDEVAGRVVEEVPGVAFGSSEPPPTAKLNAASSAGMASSASHHQPAGVLR